MWSRMVCRSGGWLLLITSLLISHHTHGAARRKLETVYIADPAGLPLSRPSNVPAKVGSPSLLIQPDRYEFYTFDESGELIKRLMTLEEIQEIIATGDGDDGHILTIAQTDVNKPAVTFNFQPPSNTKVHSIVSNVQNVLKSEMEAQKNNPPKEGVFDTPDVSSSWSQILPAIFGNTGGSIAPDSLVSPHVGPETDFITVDKDKPISGSVDKISNEEFVKEKTKPIENNSEFDSIINTNTQAEDLLDDEIFESKTTVDETPSIPTQSTATTTEPTTKSNIKIEQPTSVRIQTTERITTAILKETPATSSRPSPSPFTRTTSTQFKQTTASIKPSTVSYKPTSNVKQTTRMPIKESTTNQNNKENKLSSVKQPSQEEKRTTIPIISTNYAATNENTRATTTKPVNIVLNESSSLPAKRPEIIQVTLATTPNKQIYTDGYDKVSTINVKQTTFTIKPTTSSNKITSPTPSRLPTASSSNNTPKTSTVQPTTEKLIITSAVTKLQTKDQTTEKIASTQKTTTSIRPTPNKVAINVTSADATVNQNTTQNSFATTRKPINEPPRLEFTTIKPVATPAPNVEKLSTQVFKNKIQSTTEKQSEYISHIQISSSNEPSTSSAIPTRPKPQLVSQSTTTYPKSTTTEKTQITPSTTQKYVKPDIDINQIINQIAQNLGDSHQYNPSINTASTHEPYILNTHILKDEITTYRPNPQKDSEQNSTPPHKLSEFSNPSTKNNYNNQEPSKPSEINKNPTEAKNRPPQENSPKLSVTTNRPEPLSEIRLTTEKFDDSSNSGKPLATKPSYELSDSITNLISQIVDPKPTIVPVKNVDQKSTNNPIASTASELLNINEDEIKTIKNEPKPSPSLTTSSGDLQKLETRKPIEVTETPSRSSEILSTNKKVETSTPLNQIQGVTKITTLKEDSKTDSEIKSTTQTTTMYNAKKPINANIQPPSGHYITRVSSVDKNRPTTNKFEIYKTSNAPTTTTIKKILTPEISTQRPFNDKISTSSLLTGEITSNISANDKPLKISLLTQHQTTFDDVPDNKPESSDDYNEDAMYETSDAGATHDDELMEMLNKYSEMFNNSPADAESKSDEIDDEGGKPLYENKKVTSYKKTDLPEDEFYLPSNTSYIPLTEKSTDNKDATELSVNTSSNKTDGPIVATIQVDKFTAENKGSNTLDHHNDTEIASNSRIEIKVKNEESKNKTTLKNSQNIDNKVIEKGSSEKKTNAMENIPIHDIKKPENVSNTENIQDSQTKDDRFKNNFSTDIFDQTTPLAVFINIKQTEKPAPGEHSIETLSTIKDIQIDRVTDSLPQKTEPVQFITTEKYIKNHDIKESKNESIVESKKENITVEYKNNNDQKLTQTVIDVKYTSNPITKTEITTEKNIINRDRPKNKTVNEQNSDVSEKNSTTNTWTLISTASPNNANHKDNPELTVNTNTGSNLQTHLIGQLHLNNDGEGLEKTTAGLSEDVYQFSSLCNELGFRYWKAITSNGIDPKRSVFVSPFAVTSLLAMMFMATRGATSEEINEILKLDDMVTFNPHIVFKNVTESIEVSKQAGVATSAIIRELYSDRSKGRLLSFYKDRVQKFYSGHVEEINFSLIGDIIRRRTNLLVKRQTWSKIPEYIKHNNLVMKPPLAVFSANIFQTDCSSASTEGRDGEMYFVVSPTIRQRRLVPVPAVVYRSGFLAGYVTELDATVVSIGKVDQIVSTILVMPGQQGSIARGDDIIDLEKRLIDSVVQDDTWIKLLKSLIPRAGLELQIPRLSHRSVINGTLSLQTLGLRDLFDPKKANLAGLNGQDNDLHVSDMILDNTFTTCGEGYIGEQHHVETYPGESSKLQRRLWRTPHRPLYAEDMTDSWDDLRDYQRAFHDPLHDMTFLSIPLHLRPRQARLPDPIVEPPRLKFDRPFMYFVRHNPTGLILHMGRYNPRLLP